MPEQALMLGSVVENLDLTKWEIVDDIPLGVVRELVFSRALGAPLGPKGEALEYPLLRHFSFDGSLWKAHWRDDIAVVVMVNLGEVHAIVRHGLVFRLVRLREHARQ